MYRLERLLTGVHFRCSTTRNLSTKKKEQPKATSTKNEVLSSLFCLFFGRNACVLHFAMAQRTYKIYKTIHIQRKMYQSIYLNEFHSVKNDCLEFILMRMCAMCWLVCFSLSFSYLFVLCSRLLIVFCVFSKTSFSTGFPTYSAMKQNRKTRKELKQQTRFIMKAAVCRMLLMHNCAQRTFTYVHTERDAQSTE